MAQPSTNPAVDSLCDLSWELFRSEPDSSVRIARDALQLSIDQGYPKGAGLSLGMIGTFYLGKEMLDSAKYFYTKSLRTEFKVNYACTRLQK